MPRDIFGGKARGPSNDDIEREAQRELERLTRAPGPSAGGMGGMAGGGMAPPSMGPKSPLEAMAEGLAQRKRVRKKRGGQPSEDRSEWTTGFAGPASNSGSVGSALGYGGGVAPGTMRKAPPPDAKPLKRRGPGDYDEDEGSEPDDDLFATEIALRDHAERFGKNLEDMVIRADPATAEAMREAAMRKFLERQPSATRSAPASGSSEDFTPPARLNLRRRGRRSEAEDEEVETEPAAEDNEPEAGDLKQLADDLRDAESSGESREALPQFGLMVDERAQLAERRADLAEERAKLAEARAKAAEVELTVAAELVAGYERRIDELEAEVEAQTATVREKEQQIAEAEEARQAAEQAARAAEEAASAAGSERRPSRRTRTPPPRKATAAQKSAAAGADRAPAKKAPSKRAPAAATAKPSAKPSKRAPVAAKAAPATKSTRKRTPPPQPAEETSGESPRLGGVLGRRLAKQQSAETTGKTRRRAGGSRS